MRPLVLHLSLRYDPSGAIDSGYILVGASVTAISETLLTVPSAANHSSH